MGRPEDDFLLKEWLLVLRGDGKSPRTIEGYRDSVRMLSAFLERGNFPALPKASAEHLREWLGELRARGNKPATVNTRYRGAAAFYKWLVAEGEVQENPLSRIEPPRVPESVQPHYEAADVAAVLKAIRGRRRAGLDGARLRATVLLLFDTGIRASELCGASKDDVDWEDQVIAIRAAKAGRERLVSIGTETTRALLAYLRRRGDGSPWLFTTLDGAKLTRSALKLALRRAFDAAGVTFQGIHAFRRAAGIEYLRGGGQAEDLRVLMGWRSPEMVRRYVQAAEAQRATAAHKAFSPADRLGL